MLKRVIARCAAPAFCFWAGAAFGVRAVGRNLPFTGHPPANHHPRLLTPLARLLL